MTSPWSNQGEDPDSIQCLRKKGGWISREALTHDKEMMNVVTRVKANASQGNRKGALNPFHAQTSEILPLDMETKTLMIFKEEGGNGF